MASGPYAAFVRVRADDGPRRVRRRTRNEEPPALASRPGHAVSSLHENQESGARRGRVGVRPAVFRIHECFGHELPVAKRLAGPDDKYDILEYGRAHRRRPGPRIPAGARARPPGGSQALPRRHHGVPAVPQPQAVLPSLRGLRPTAWAAVHRVLACSARRRLPDRGTAGDAQLRNRGRGTPPGRSSAHPGVSGTARGGRHKACFAAEPVARDRGGKPLPDHGRRRQRVRRRRPCPWRRRPASCGRPRGSARTSPVRRRSVPAPTPSHRPWTH